MRYRFIVALLYCLVAPIAMASQSDPRLPELFRRLLETTDRFEAQSVEQAIWQIWLFAEDKEADRDMNAGIDLMQKGDLQAAIDLFSRLIARAPDFSEAWNKRATAYYLVGDYNASVADVQKTLELEPKHFGALAGLGLINVALGRHHAAVKAFEEALKINPHMPGIRRNLEEIRRMLQGQRT
jgi:tetratricopeptide (TPR) repeat protein